MGNQIPLDTEVVEKATARLYGASQNLPNFQALLDVFSGRFQLMENQIDDLLNNMSFGLAAGVQLDTIGVILDLTRIVGESDSAYRTRLISRAAELAQSGEVETLISTYKLITAGAPILYAEFYPATAQLTAVVVTDDFTAEEDAATLAGMEAVKAGGVRLVLQVVQSNRFILGDSANADANGNVASDPNHGLGDSADADVNGNIAPGVGKGGNLARVL